MNDITEELRKEPSAMWFGSGNTNFSIVRSLTKIAMVDDSTMDRLASLQITGDEELLYSTISDIIDQHGETLQ